MQKIRILIYGNVHGVGFRYFIERSAKYLGLKGYVRNLQDCVEVIVEGPEKELSKLIELCNQGPSSAKVTNIKVKKEEFKNEFSSFEILH